MTKGWPNYDDPPTDEDYDDMLHALGRPASATAATYRNHYVCEDCGDKATRFEHLGWWDFFRTINNGRDAVYMVNEAGKRALDDWMGLRQVLADALAKQASLNESGEPNG